MSKIYEALIRAEQERNAADARQKTHTGLNAQEYREAEVLPRMEDLAAIPTFDPKFEVRDERPAVVTYERRVEHPVEAAVEAPGVAIGNIDPPIHDRRLGDLRSSDFDLGKIPICAWNPSIDHLPALEERGRAVEQFRSLRSRMYEFRDLNTLKSVLVSSGLPQEGKSFVAANLAISLACHKASRVLLIDGDMRRSSLHQLLGTHSEPGLAEYLAGSATLIEIMQNAALLEDGSPMPSGLSSLTFISAGRDTNTAADLSGNYRFDELIKAVSPHFDWVIVDSSPVNLVADGVNLARSCDGVLLVARAGVTKFEVAQRAATELKASNILGFVLNAVAKPTVTGGYYGYDNYDSYDSYSTYDAKSN